ncbi:hypothetical protein pipiens_013948 [Culex pipiens pipiens]|uniref:Uncharacterized protein n=1 Tax=Culex pipiens pipiens TaxID=38569 RepID=A0ABD1CWE7_CULPP
MSQRRQTQLSQWYGKLRRVSDHSDLREVTVQRRCGVVLHAVVECSEKQPNNQWLHEDIAAEVPRGSWFQASTSTAFTVAWQEPVYEERHRPKNGHRKLLM